MVSNLMGNIADEAGGFVDDAVGEDLAKADQILQGAERAPIDIEKIEAEFLRGEDLGTPDGDIPGAAAAPNDAKAGGKPKAAKLSTGKRIEIIHFGYVHRDRARNFDHSEVMNDLAAVDLAQVVGSRAIAYRAALEREAVLLAGFARAAQVALAEKDQKEGATGDLLTAAADLLGGSGGTAQSASSADLTQFLDKIEQQAWSLLNKRSIRYADLHEAGIKLHEVRVNLRGYLREQLAAQANPPPAAKGLLSDLPFIGEIPIPGELGTAIGFMQKVTGKLYDVQNALMFDLMLVMQKPIEAACMKVSIDSIRKRRSPIYPAWFLPPKTENGEDREPFADYQMGNVLDGDLTDISALDQINKSVQDGVGRVNQGINDAVEKPMELVDFLTKDVEPAPGSPYLKDIFQAQPVPDGAYFGSAYLGKKAVGAFGRAMGSGEVPGFMTGFVGTIVENVFAVCAEFLRAVYDKLCCLEPGEFIMTAELVAAGRQHLVFQIVELVLEKTGLDEILEKLTLEIPRPPMLPAGINWPEGTMSVEPIIAELKSVLSEKLGPYLDPVVEYLMAGLAHRLNGQRMWAGSQAMTMEAHLAQLPAELALMFRGLFGPLWKFLTDTLMGVINNVVGKILGPIGNAVGVAQDGLGKVTGYIDEAKKKAAQAQAYAKNIEEKAKDLLTEASSIQASLTNQQDLQDIKNAGETLQDAFGTDPFADDEQGPMDDENPGGPLVPFPANRMHTGKGIKIAKADLDAMKDKFKWDEAKEEGKVADEIASEEASA